MGFSCGCCGDEERSPSRLIDVSTVEVVVSIWDLLYHHPVVTVLLVIVPAFKLYTSAASGTSVAEEEKHFIFGL
jgi:hypothetical protein